MFFATYSLPFARIDWTVKYLGAKTWNYFYRQPLQSIHYSFAALRIAPDLWITWHYTTLSCIGLNNKMFHIWLETNKRRKIRTNEVDTRSEVFTRSAVSLSTMGCFSACWAYANYYQIVFLGHHYIPVAFPDHCDVPVCLINLVQA